jgi:hypothetical protein
MHPLLNMRRSGHSSTQRTLFGWDAAITAPPHERSQKSEQSYPATQDSGPLP